MKIAIVGLGQIGGSMALRLKEKGYDPDLFDLNHELCDELNGKCEEFSGHGYDLVILALYADVILKIMKNLPKDNLYLDTASVKAPIVDCALKNGIRLIGGHPIAGNEKKGKESWDSKMFENSPFAIVDTQVGGIEIVNEFVFALGANPVIVNSEFHDMALAHTSQGLYFISKALKALGEPYESLSGPGYKSMTRLSKQNPLLEETFRKYNSENISLFLNDVIKALEKISAELK